MQVISERYRTEIKTREIKYKEEKNLERKGKNNESSNKIKWNYMKAKLGNTKRNCNLNSAAKEIAGIIKKLLEK